MEYIGVIWPIDPNHLILHFQPDIQVGLPKPILKLNNLKVAFLLWLGQQKTGTTKTPPLTWFPLAE